MKNPNSTNPSSQKNSLRIIKKSSCPKLSSRAKGSLTYHVAYADADKTFYLRTTANQGGFFSNEWVCLNDILETIESHTLDASSCPFKALILRHLFLSKSANNHGFLAAVLRSEGILLAVDNHPLSHTLADLKAFKSSMQKLIKEKVSLDDEVAEAERVKEAKRAEMVEAMKKKVEETAEVTAKETVQEAVKTTK